MENVEIEKFMGKVRKTKSCWIWIGYKRPDGYGNLGVNGYIMGAHRRSYQLLVGTIPQGYQIDHLCKNPSCVNPKHLEAVTPRENTLRSNNFSAKQARQTHCIRNHQFTEENTYKYGNHRKCKICTRNRRRESYKPAHQRGMKKRNSYHGKSKCCKARIDYSGGGYDGEDIVPVTSSCMACLKENPKVIRKVGRPRKFPF